MPTVVWIIVVSIAVGLLVTVAFPAFARGWRLSEGRRILADARQMDSAIDQWADDAKKQEGNAIDTSAVASYLKGGLWPATDLMGNPYIVDTVGSKQISISPSTKAVLGGLGIDWGNY